MAVSRHTKFASKLSAVSIPALVSVLVLALAACGGSGGSGGGSGGGTAGSTAAGGAAHTSSGSPKQGGAATVLLPSDGWASGLDPATNTTGGVTLDQSQAIFGGLFLLEANDDGSNAHIVPSQAESYKYSSDGKTLTIKIRPGIKFSDGTDFDADAVAWNFKRDIKASCTCAPKWPLTKTDGITVTDPLTVELHFTRPNPSAINGFPVTNANWIASPDAYKTMGEAKFKLEPVGAGPFTVVRDTLSTELVLKRNSTYFQKGLPYLDSLTFKKITGDEAGYQALLAHNADAFVGVSTPPIVQKAKQSGQLTVTDAPAVSPYMIQFNTFKAPFNSIKAREAIYYATDWAAIDKGIFNNEYPVSQSFTAPGGLFYHKEVPGYRTYDLAKAKQLVKELGGLKFDLMTVNIYTAQQMVTAMQTQWKQAGIQVTTHSLAINQIIQKFNDGSWQGSFASAGEWDPAVGISVAFRFSSTSPFTGVKDPHLDELINQAAGTLDNSKRDSLYQQVAKYLSDKAYGVFGIVYAPTNIAVAGVHGPGLTTKIPPLSVNAQVLWGRVWRETS
jgi:peptide/nickel transport system substrate-binding protein